MDKNYYTKGEKSQIVVGDYDNAPNSHNYGSTRFTSGYPNESEDLLPAHYLSEEDYKQQIVTGSRPSGFQTSLGDNLEEEQNHAYVNSILQNSYGVQNGKTVTIDRQDPSYYDSTVEPESLRRVENRSIEYASPPYRQSGTDTVDTVFNSPHPVSTSQYEHLTAFGLQNPTSLHRSGSVQMSSGHYGYNDGDYDNAPPVPHRTRVHDDVDLSVASRREHPIEGLHSSVSVPNSPGQRGRLESVDERGVLPVSRPTGALINSGGRVRVNKTEPKKFHGTSNVAPLPALFEAIRTKCLNKQRLFIDPEFPPNDATLYSNQPRPNYASRIKWVRPPAIAAHYKLPPKFVDGFSIDDIVQGALGDCYLLASFACLAGEVFERTVVLPHVVPEHQSFDPGWYAGVFCFRFWKFGKWQVVIIDDLLPTVDGRLIYLSSNQPNEFWGALVEKAYAKFKGSYAALDGGYISNAMEDITGGLAESYDFREGHAKEFPSPSDLEIIFKADSHQHSLMGGGIDSRPPEEVIATDPTGQILRTGLIGGHAYTILEVKEFKYTRVQPDGSKSITLLRARNPWGKVEWNGPWSDKSSLWDFIDGADKALNIDRDDGSFWISIDDYRACFSSVIVCHLPPPITMCWGISTYRGKWVQRVSAGGPPSNVYSFYTNPQYLLTISKADETMPIIVGLMQPDKSAIRGESYFALGFLIYPLKPDQNPPMDRHFFSRTRAVYIVDSFFEARSIVKRVILSSGRYVIVPCTFNPNEESEFFLRVFHYDDRDGNTKAINDPDGPIVTASNRDGDCRVTRKNRKLPGINNDDRKKIVDNTIQNPGIQKKNGPSNIFCCTSNWTE